MRAAGRRGRVLCPGGLLSGGAPRLEHAVSVCCQGGEPGLLLTSRRLPAPVTGRRRQLS